jgi:hypothetical protein
LSKDEAITGRLIPNYEIRSHCFEPNQLD